MYGDQWDVDGYVGGAGMSRVAGERLWRTAGGGLVRDGDPEALVLAYAAGDPVNDDEKLPRKAAAKKAAGDVEDVDQGDVDAGDVEDVDQGDVAKAVKKPPNKAAKAEGDK